MQSCAVHSQRITIHYNSQFTSQYQLGLLGSPYQSSTMFKLTASPLSFKLCHYVTFNQNHNYSNAIFTMQVLFVTCCIMARCFHNSEAQRVNDIIVRRYSAQQWTRAISELWQIITGDILRASNVSVSSELPLCGLQASGPSCFVSIPSTSSFTTLIAPDRLPSRSLVLM